MLHLVDGLQLPPAKIGHESIREYEARQDDEEGTSLPLPAVQSLSSPPSSPIRARESRRPRKNVIHSSSSEIEIQESSEIQETQQQTQEEDSRQSQTRQGGGEHNSIEVRVSEASSSFKAGYTFIQLSSSAQETQEAYDPSSYNAFATSSKDQEQDSALGLSSPIDDSQETFHDAFESVIPDSQDFQASASFIPGGTDSAEISGTTTESQAQSQPGTGTQILISAETFVIPESDPTDSQSQDPYVSHFPHSFQPAEHPATADTPSNPPRKGSAVSTRSSDQQHMMADSSREGTPKMGLRDGSRARSEVPSSSIREKLRNIRGASITKDNEESRRQNQSMTRSMDFADAPAKSIEDVMPPLLESIEKTASVPGSLNGDSLPISEPMITVLSEDGSIRSVDAPHSKFMSPRSHMLPISQAPPIPLPLARPHRTVAIHSTPQFSSREHAIILPMEGKAQDQYRNWIKDSREKGFITKYLSRPPTHKSHSEDLQNRMSILVERLKGVCFHTDLDISEDIQTQQEQSAEAEAQWAENASSKFYFLGQLLQYCRDLSMHIIILASEGRPLDIIETYLKGKHVSCSRAGGLTTTYPYHTNLQITLLSTSDDSGNLYPTRPIMAIAFDSSYRAAHPRLQDERTGWANIPILHLLVSNSVEHIEKCLPSTLKGLERLWLLAKIAKRLSPHVGLFANDRPLIPDDPTHADIVQAKRGLQVSQTQRIVQLIMYGLTSGSLNGTLNQMVNPDLPLIESDQSLEPSEPTMPVPSSVMSSRPGTPANQKRLLDGEEESRSGTPKRQRLTPLADITHISDSMKDGSSQAESLRQSLKAAEQRQNEDARRMNDLEASLASVQKELQDHISSLSKLQHRYESISKSRHELRKEGDKLKSNLATSEQRLEKQTIDIAKMRDERATFQEELRFAREALKGEATTTTVAELELARVEIAKLVKEKSDQTKTIENIRKDFEFTRQQYQMASTSAAEMANANSQLETQIASLKIQLTAKDMKDMNLKDENVQHRARVEQLERQMKVNEKILMKKDEELRMRGTRGRGVATRASSAQPGSPKPSRASSPAPGVLAVAGPRGSALRYER